MSKLRIYFLTSTFSKVKSSGVLNPVPTGILVKMLKKEKKAAKDAAAQLANITNGQNLASQSALRVSTPPSSRDGSTETISPDHAGRAKQYMKRGALSFFLYTTFSNVLNFIDLKCKTSKCVVIQLTCSTLSDAK